MWYLQPWYVSSHSDLAAASEDPPSRTQGAALSLPVADGRGEEKEQVGHKSRKKHSKEKKKEKKHKKDRDKKSSKGVQKSRQKSKGKEQFLEILRAEREAREKVEREKANQAIREAHFGATG